MSPIRTERIWPLPRVEIDPRSRLAVMPDHEAIDPLKPRHGVLALAHYYAATFIVARGENLRRDE